MRLQATSERSQAEVMDGVMTSLQTQWQTMIHSRSDQDFKPQTDSDCHLRPLFSTLSHQYIDPEASKTACKNITGLSNIPVKPRLMKLLAYPKGFIAGGDGGRGGGHIRLINE